MEQKFKGRQHEKKMCLNPSPRPIMEFSALNWFGRCLQETAHGYVILNHLTRFVIHE